MFLRPNHFLHKELFSTKTVLSLSTNTIFYTKNNVLVGPVQGLFAAYRIALSMVAGGTRQRRLNRSSQHVVNQKECHLVI